MFMKLFPHRTRERFLWLAVHGVGRIGREQSWKRLITNGVVSGCPTMDAGRGWLWTCFRGNWIFESSWREGEENRNEKKSNPKGKKRHARKREIRNSDRKKKKLLSDFLFN